MLNVSRLNKNKVLVKIEKEFEDTLKCGIALDTKYNPTLHTSIVAEVVKICDELFYSEYSPNSMNWECDIDIQIGDTIFANFDMYFKAKDKGLMFNNETGLYYIIDYEDIRLVKRGEDTIMCNGYILLEPIAVKDVPSELIPKHILIDPNDDRNQKRFAKIYKTGKPNRHYLQSHKVDAININIGDLVILRNSAAILLETNMNRKYEDRDLWCCQGWTILAKIETI